MNLIVPPTWQGYYYPIPLGPPGYVLTMVGAVPAFAPASGGGSSGYLGSRLAYAAAAGTYSAAPAGFPGASSSPIGSLIVTLPSGSATWTGLTLGNAQQLLGILNDDANNTLTLDPGAGGSVPFVYFGELALPPKTAVMLWCDTTLNAWVIA